MSPRFLILLAVLLARALHAQDDTPVFIVKNEVIPSPAASGAFAPRLANALDGTVYLSWLEPAANHHIAFRFSRFDAATHAWSPARTIGEAFANDVPRDQTPKLALIEATHIAALWQPSAALATFSTSADGGANWSKPTVLNRPRHLATYATLQFLPDGQLLAAWIEPGSSGNALLALSTASNAETVIVDPSVSPGCAPSIAAFPDSSALLAYRGLTSNGVRDILTARFHDGQWEQPSPLIHDNWQPAAPPHDGPSLAVRGVHVSGAWFTSAVDARVNVSTSDNAGAQWLVANRIDDVAPLGHPDLVLFDDGSQVVSWVEATQNSQVILLRRISARGNLSVPVQIGHVVKADVTAPSLARVKDGDATPAQVLATYLQPATTTSDPATLITRLITLPSPAQLAEADPCGCDPRPEDMRGYPLEGRVLTIDAAHGTLQLTHAAILGVMKAGTTTVQASPEVLRTVQPGHTILARIERTGSDWTLFNVRVLVRLPAASH
ncbi:MAG TPA: hypothetical protein VL357_00255 [Rariglobus sp.]|jgi:hypothetical protein|nr:hypothetical protein [Rariglobus sp.]